MISENSEKKIMQSRLKIEDHTGTYKNSKNKSQSRKKRVLYVENDPAVFKVVNQMLKLLGYEAVISEDSKEAWRMIESQPKHFDLVITDMNMSGMGGLDLSRKVLEIRPDIPIILCTGLDALEIGSRAKEAGIQAIIPKPFLFQDLKNTISKALMEG